MEWLLNILQFLSLQIQEEIDNERQNGNYNIQQWFMAELEAARRNSGDNGRGRTHACSLTTFK